MTKRAIIKIDESKCNGCGLCVPSCAEGALQIVDGKARVVSEKFCDGLGACLGECPQGALTIEERDADEFDMRAAMEYMAKSHDHGGCPGSRAMVIERKRPDAAQVPAGSPTKSALGQWPVQLGLVPVQAPYFRNADLLVTADCVPFALPDYHSRYLQGRAVVVGCPKLDETGPYVEKLADIIALNNLKSITILRMEVPCCGGMVRVVKSAAALAGVEVPIEEVVISLEGEVIS
jgi:Pyruvate/2-oxoacid:ferredoxin oxidoreductase delta subunit